MPLNRKILLCVTLCSVLIGTGLTAAAWDMNFWPSDAKAYYYDAAVDLPTLGHLSDIHLRVDGERVRWLHGKEIFIQLISWTQRLMKDTETIRPFLVLGTVSVAAASVLIYIIALSYWGRAAALVCYAGFTFSVWPYVYVLFAKHQTTGLLFFLLAVWFLQQSRRPRYGAALMFLSGLSLGLSFFTSTVSALYLPFYAAAFITFFCGTQIPWGLRLRRAAVSGVEVLVGISAVVIYVNWPQLGWNIQGYLDYVAISGAYNHFYYNQPALQQWFPNSDVAAARGGWLWVARYLQLILPVLLPLYGVTVLFLLSRWNRIGRMAQARTGLMVVLSLAPVLMAEKVHAAQYGANYFPALTGILILLGYGVHRWQKEVHGRLPRYGRRAAVTVLGGILAAHAGISMMCFAGDVFPTRMATTFLSRRIQELGIEKLYTYFVHPHRNFFAPVLNPDVGKTLRFGSIQFLPQARDGYILVPPVTGDSIYLAAISDYNDFDSDVFLNALIENKRLKDYAVGTFPTMANSRIWRQEEEIMSYRDLILGQHFPDDERKGRVWLLDAARMAADRAVYIPCRKRSRCFRKGSATSVRSHGGWPSRERWFRWNARNRSGPFWCRSTKSATRRIFFWRMSISATAVSRFGFRSTTILRQSPSLGRCFPPTPPTGLPDSVLSRRCASTRGSTGL